MVGLSQNRYPLMVLIGLKLFDRIKKDLSKIDEDFIKNYDKGCDKVYILEVDVKYPKNLHGLHSDLSFLPERIKIDKCNKLVRNLYDKKLCCSYKIIKTSIKSWANFKESSQSNPI